MDRYARPKKSIPVQLQVHIFDRSQRARKSVTDLRPKDVNSAVGRGEEERGDERLNGCKLYKCTPVQRSNG